MTRYRKQDPEITRRRFINAAMGTTATVGIVSLVGVLGTANPVFRLTRDKMPPVEGDILVHAAASQEGDPIKISELSEQLVRAWPMGKDKDGNNLIRKGDPNNVLAVYRFPKGQIIAPTIMEATVDGEIVAYSDVCTHAGCSVADDDQTEGQMKCPCHSGQYDPKRGCIVVGGPPPRGLAQLPIKQQGDNLVVGGFFLANPYPFTESEWEARKEAVKAQLA
ncbi:ubiquinol-cytochrome c reductase iron-sulfur subunit [Deinococcus arenicola]|uniref:Ubiquinol-cytochrome c reductase iron-sulfur subunit n=1 Tax=Deinococcus arenicola TaxID=2994950 RepID=A0ABU4DUG2_9DEIO|nr:ubiquinol-cytochrome c reductase iron-sulfur subunit [Deinococcus sp. ZS9-10]MDV6376073.1 ubiquinol-cytochrome c reductase iron-sulfur subunit [Deinococcus sp. ZS9-10]